MNLKQILSSQLARFTLIALASFSLIAFLTSQPSLSQNSGEMFSPEDVEFSFVVVGCNRVDKADVDKNSPSTANIAHINRTFKEVAELTPAPKFLFFAGDLVFGYTSDPAKLEKQLVGWRSLYENSPLAKSKTELIPVSGNHETQNEKKVSYEAAEKTWLKVMAPYLKYAGNGPRAGGKDDLKTDQSSLTYSFNYKNSHFVVLNTDPVGKDWSVPKSWVGEDVATARKRFAKHIFAIGHKPAYAYPTNLYNPPEAKEDGLGKFYPGDRDELWASLVSSKAEAMLSAHDHVYYRTRGSKGNTWQIIAGNGGSVIDKVKDQSTQNFYGYTLVSVLKDNRVMVTSYGWEIPKNYLDPSTAPTVIRDRADISWNK